MSRKIKLHTFNVLFQLFAYLADKTGGWRVFVRPKLLLGSLIMGWGLMSSEQAVAQNPSNKKTSNDDKTLNNKDTTQSKKTDENVWCYVTEQMPTYPDGDAALMAFISKNLKYPKEAIKKKIEGKVILGFVIDSTGVVRDVSVLRSLGPACDKEAIRVVKLLPRWIPGYDYLNKKKTNVRYTLPLKFKLPKE
ncbi:MAG: energy transducer TonB [Paludibacter sp.]|nr:energy transducer TonB [Paludibacter sp.]